MKEILQPLLEVGLGAWYVHMAMTQLHHRLYVSSLVTMILSAGLFTMGGATLRAVFAGREGPADPGAPLPVPSDG